MAKKNVAVGTPKENETRENFSFTDTIEVACNEGEKPKVMYINSDDEMIDPDEPRVIYCCPQHGEFVLSYNEFMENEKPCPMCAGKKHHVCLKHGEYWQ